MKISIFSAAFYSKWVIVKCVNFHIVLNMRLEILLFFLIQSTRKCFSKRLTSLETSFNNNTVATAIKEIILNHYIEQKIRFDIIYAKENSDRLSVLVNEILSDQTVKNSIKLERLYKEQYKLSQSAILLFETYQSLIRFNKNVTLTNSHAQVLNFLVFCAEALPKKVAMVKSKILHFESILRLAQNGSLKLIRYNMFTKSAFLKPQPIELNRFSSLTMKWERSTYFDSEMNFFGCQLTIDFPVLRKPYTNIVNSTDGTEQQAGFLYDFMEELAKFYNFRTIYNTFDILKFDLKKAMTKVQFRLETRKLHSYYIYNKRNIAPLHIMTSEVLIVPPSGLYSPFEKLILPFDLETWIWILIFFGIGFLTVFVIYRCPRKIQQFVFGLNISTPSMNLTGTFFGIGQIALPGRNFSRYILMMFILFCLIIRTAYQGKMFEILQKDLRKPEIQTIDELFEKNITVLLTKGDDYRELDVLSK